LQQGKGRAKAVEYVIAKANCDQINYQIRDIDYEKWKQKSRIEESVDLLFELRR